jgi:ectoine hydroxylase-related dioxygenase (phytanoyl-CoA dioxygenase family)
MNVLSNDQKDFYDNQGYLIVPNIFDGAEIDDTKKVVFDTFKKFVEVDRSLLNLPQPWNHFDFDLALLRLRSSDPKLFGAMYDTAQNNVRLVRMVTKNSLVMRAADLLSTSTDMIATSGHYLRMDAPQDQRNVLKWHQDRAYYHQNKDGDNGIVATVALNDISEENGALRVCPKSHKRGFLGVTEGASKESYEVSEQLIVSDNEVSTYEEISANLKSGEVLFINMNLFHRSGHNSSNRFRFTALTRIHKMSADDYVPFGIIFNYNAYCKDKIYGN